MQTIATTSTNQMSTAGRIGLRLIRSVVAWIWILGLVGLLGLGSCGRSPSTDPDPIPTGGVIPLERAEVPTEIARLSEYLEHCSPTVRILSPEPDQVLTSNRVEVSFEVRGYPLFKDPDLGLGPHLHVIVDNEPYVAYYDTSKPLIFDHLALGSHTIRAFAGTPWHESFKNTQAYAQVTFHVGAKTPEYVPDPELPLLTYSRPKGSYGAEPILLDFWLANAPIRETLLTDIPSDWRIRYTVNGQSGILDQWQPLYLRGFQPGSNVVVVELVNSTGDPIRNVFNSAAREVVYTPGGQDTLSRLVRGELKAEEALSIVLKSDGIKSEPLKPDLLPPDLLPPDLLPPEPQPTPAAPQDPTPAPILSSPTPEPSPTATPTPIPEPTATPMPSPEPTATPTPQPTPEPTATPTPKPKPKSTPRPRQRIPEPQPIPQELSGELPPDSPPESQPPISSSSPTPQPTPQPEVLPEPTPLPTPAPTPTPQPQYTPIPYIKPTPIPRITPVPYAQRGSAQGEWQWGSRILPSDLRKNALSQKEQRQEV